MIESPYVNSYLYHRNTAEYAAAAWARLAPSSWKMLGKPESIWKRRLEDMYVATNRSIAVCWNGLNLNKTRECSTTKAMFLFHRSTLHAHGKISLSCNNNSTQNDSIRTRCPESVGPPVGQDYWSMTSKGYPPIQKRTIYFPGAYETNSASGYQLAQRLFDIARAKHGSISDCVNQEHLRYFSDRNAKQCYPLRPRERRQSLCQDLGWIRALLPCSPWKQRASVHGTQNRTQQSCRR
jgi:hypothetical protein